MSKTEYLKRQGKRIKRAREWRGLTQEEFAEKVAAELGESFDDAKVSRIEQGKQDINGRVLHVFSLLLEQPTTWLQGVDDDGFNSEAMGVYLRSLTEQVAA